VCLLLGGGLLGSGCLLGGGLLGDGLLRLGGLGLGRDLGFNSLLGRFGLLDGHLHHRLLLGDDCLDGLLRRLGFLGGGGLCLLGRLGLLLGGLLGLDHLLLLLGGGHGLAQLERTGGSLALGLHQLSVDDSLLQVLADEGRELLGVDLVRGGDVLLDGLQRAAASLLQVLDGSINHLRGRRVSRDDLLGGSLRGARLLGLGRLGRAGGGGCGDGCVRHG
jgi:hypothetical protein